MSKNIISDRKLIDSEEIEDYKLHHRIKSIIIIIFSII